jgi:competence protein ComEA
MENKMKLTLLIALILSTVWSGLTLAAANSSNASGKDIFVTKSVVKTNRNNLVNINLADLNSFTTLKGISKKRATTIIAYRNANGNFQSVEDLTKVKGLSKKVVDANRARLVV